jgi:glycosyltransferase involved in cell wall biosynthesis
MKKIKFASRRVVIKTAIVMPAYNEEKRIGRTLEEFGKFFSKRKKEKDVDYRIIIVINDTADRTEEIVKKYSKKHREIKYLNFKQGGKGFAVIEGFKEALKSNYDLIGFVDADLSTSPEAFYDLIKNIKDYDGIIASRYVKGAVVKTKQSLSRIVVSRLGNFLIRSFFFLPYRDTQCGAKLFKRKVIERVLPKLRLTQWAFDINLIYAARREGFKVKEHPTVWKDAEASHLNLKTTGIQVLLSIIQLRIINSPLHKLLKPLKPVIGPLWRALK